MSQQLQMQTRSGRIYGPAHPVWIGKTLEILDNLRMTIGEPKDLEPKSLGKTRRLYGRAKDLCEMTCQDDYWFVVLPIFLKRLTEHLTEIEEFWAPVIVRELTAVAEGITRA
jgi:hypothetical protein